jgi:hypothetical protein
MQIQMKKLRQIITKRALMAGLAFTAAVPPGWLDAAENPTRTVEANQEACSPLPARGAASSQPAKSWEGAFVSGNGRMGEVEGMNNKAKVVSHRCYGFRTAATYITALYHCLGKLPEPELVHKFL